MEQTIDIAYAVHLLFHAYLLPSTARRVRRPPGIALPLGTGTMWGVAPILPNQRSSIRKIVFLALLLSVRMQALELYISPEGNDSWSGTLSKPNGTKTDGPLATLAGARDALRKQDHRREAVDVIVAEGNYEMTKTLELTPADSGSADFPVTYRAAEDARPVFSGGRVIKGWKQESEGLWSAELPDVASGRWTFEQLWVDGNRATRARDPNRGFYRIASATEGSGSSGETGIPSGWSKQTIGMKLPDLDQLAKTSDEDLNSVQLVAYHFWQTTRRYLTGFDRSTGVLAFVAPTRHSYAGLKAGARYYLENALAFLDAPGEWYLSRTGKLYYRPRPGEDLAKATVVAPRLSTLFAFKGAAGHFIEYLSFQGLSFRYSQWITPPDGVFPDQSAFSIHAAVMADGVRHVSLENCEISHTGKYALWFRNGCSNVIVRHCLFQDLGGGGIRVGGMTLPADGAQRTSNVEVDNNIICHGGRIFPSAVGIWIGTSSDNKITHNDVSDFYSTGISIGWQWGYAASSASGNRIDFNHIHHLGWGLLSDLGGIYTLGMSPGTECNGNVIHDIRAGDYGGWGIYFDEGSSQILAENNLVYATTHGGFHQHYGRENLVRNNIFALNRDAQLQLTLSEPHLSLTFEHNIIYWQKGELFAYEWGRADIQSDYNLFFQASTSESRFDNKSLLASEPQGRDLHSQVADPGFRKPASGDFTLPVNSPAFQVGFKPFDYQQAGVYGTEEWRRLAETLSGRLCPIGWSTIHSPPGEGFVSMRERCPLNTRSSAERGSATRF